MNEVMKSEGYIRPILLLNDFIILLVEVGDLLVFVMNRNVPRHGGGYPSQAGGGGDRWRGLESGLPACTKRETGSLVLRVEVERGLEW